MEFRGTVKDGVVVLEKGTSLEEGLEVSVRPVLKQPSMQDAKPASTLGSRLMKFAGKAKDLPSDAARSRDHYL
jgi:hypothetical protein